MNPLAPEIIVAALMLIGTIITNVIGGRHTKNLVVYRLEQVEITLDKKLDRIGNMLDRLARLEARMDSLEDKR